MSPRASAFAMLVALACRENDAATRTPTRLSPAEAEAALAERETREDARVAAGGGEVRPEAAAPAAGEGVNFTARLLDAQARPLAGAQLAWLVPTPEGFPAPRLQARAEASGATWLAVPRADLAQLAVLELVADAPGTMRHLLRIPRERCEGETIVSLGEILLQPGGAVRGRVLDEGGEPLAGAGVGIGPELAALGGDAQELRLLARVFPMLQDLGLGNAPPLALTDGQGRFVLEGVPLGRFMVVAAAPQTDGRVLVPDREEGVLVQAGQATSVRDLVLRRARAEELVAGIVLAPDGTAVAGALVDLQQGGRSFAGGRTQSGVDGRFAVPAPTGLELELHVLDPEGRYRAGVLPGVRAGEPNAVVSFAGAAAVR